MRQALIALAAVASLGRTALAWAKPLQPSSDAQVLVQLNDAPAQRQQQRQWQQQLTRQPRHEPSALALGHALLGQARTQGDARFAGRALAVLAPFGDAPPPAIAVLRATVLQHLHQFDASAALLQRTLRQEAQLPQAWLLLASVRRTQGRLDQSDAACQGLMGAGATLHARACGLENASLRKPANGLANDPATDPAAWDALLAPARLDAATRAWLLQSKAEHLQRADRIPEAEAAMRESMALRDEPYTRTALADLLWPQHRHAEAIALLQDLPASDAVMVRLAAHAQAINDPRAAAWVADMRSRIAQSRETLKADPTAPQGHLREHAMFALYVDRQAQQALAWAKANAQLQREPIDLHLLAEAKAATAQQAAAAGSAKAMRGKVSP